MVGKSVRQAPIYDEIEDLGGKKTRKEALCCKPMRFYCAFCRNFQAVSIVNVQAAQN